MRVIGELAAQRLRQLIDRSSGVDRPAGGGGARGRMPVLVRCTAATAAAGSGVGAQCYPGVIVDPRAGETTQPTLGDVWLTLLDGTGVAVPSAGAVYGCVLAGPVEAATGDTRPRAFAAKQRVRQIGTASVNVTAGAVTSWTGQGGESGTTNMTAALWESGAAFPLQTGYGLYWEQAAGSGNYKYVPLASGGGTVPGFLTGIAQTIAGAKTFTSVAAFSAGLTGTTATLGLVKADYGEIGGWVSPPPPPGIVPVGTLLVNGGWYGGGYDGGANAGMNVNGYSLHNGNLIITGGGAGTNLPGQPGNHGGSPRLMGAGYIGFGVTLDPRIIGNSGEHGEAIMSGTAGSNVNPDDPGGIREAVATMLLSMATTTQFGLTQDPIYVTAKTNASAGPGNRGGFAVSGAKGAWGTDRAGNGINGGIITGIGGGAALATVGANAFTGNQSVTGNATVTGTITGTLDTGSVGDALVAMGGITG